VRGLAAIMVLLDAEGSACISTGILKIEVRQDTLSPTTLFRNHVVTSQQPKIFTVTGRTGLILGLRLFIERCWFGVW
jgi:hypothetical protein